MAATVTWSAVAIEDLQDIYHYASKHSDQYANKILNTLSDRVEMLEIHPYLGRMVPEYEQGHIRELIEGDYRIIYYLTSEDRVEIAHVWHSARPLSGLF